jgi:hypothetical protein
LHRIDDGTDGGALVGGVNVGDGFKPVFCFDGFEDFESSLESCATIASDRCTICLIEGAFKENVQFWVLLLEGSEGVGDGPTGVEAFERAGASEEEQLFGIVNHRRIKCEGLDFAKSQSKKYV